MFDEKFKKYVYMHIPIETVSYDKIVNLFNDNKMYEASTSGEYWYLGFYYEENKEWNKAEQCYMEAVKTNNCHMINNFAYFYFGKNLFDKAIEYYSKSAELGNTLAMIYLAQIYLYKMNDPVKEEEYYLKATNLLCPIATGYLAKCYYSRGDIVKYVDYSVKAIELGNVKSMCDLASYYYNQNDLIEAKKYYLKAAKSGDIEGINGLGFYYKNVNKYDKAEAEFVKAAKLSGNYNFVIGLYDIQQRYEELLILVYDHSHGCDHERVNLQILKYLNILNYPVSDKYCQKIYEIIEKLDVPNNDKISTNVFKILQDAISFKKKTLCHIAYHLKKRTKIQTKVDDILP